MATPPAVDFAKRLVTQTMADDVPELAAGLAFRFLFAIFPFLIFLAALAAFVAQAIGLGDPTGQIMSAIGDNLPPDVAAQVTPQVQQVLGQTRPALLSIGAILALWAATGAISSLQKAMNSAYDVPETRNIVVKTGGAVLLTLLASAGILVAFVTVVGGSLLTQEAIKALHIPPSTWDTVSLVRWPIVLALVAIAVAILLKYAPNVSVSFRWTLVGGVVFAVTWLVATAGFAFYVANFANYANTYGALGGVIVMLLWFYLTAILLLVSAELTSLLVKSREPHKVENRKREIREGVAGKAAEKGSEMAGVAVGTAKGHVEDVRERERRVAGERPGRPAPTPAATSTPGRHRTLSPGALVAAAIVAAGAIVGALIGLVVGTDEEGASSA